MPDPHNPTPALQQALRRLLRQSFAPEGDFTDVGPLAVESEGETVATGVTMLANPYYLLKERYSL